MLPSGFAGGGKVGVSRFGVNPKPTVTVRMKENGAMEDCQWCAPAWVGGSLCSLVPHALILVLTDLR